MPGQITRGQVERLTQVAELSPPRLGRDGQDPQPVSLVDDLVQPVGRMVGHDGCAVVDASPASGGSAGRGRRRRCTTQAPAPDSKSTRAGSTTFGRRLAVWL